MSETGYVLLVEDDPNDEMLTLRAFKKINLANKLVVVHDGAEALDFLFARGEYGDRNGQDLPRVVLLDLKLPKIDGIEVLRKVREDAALKSLPVVILTSSDEQHDMVRSYDGGANSYVRKPVEFNDFIAAISKLGLYWCVLNRVPE